MKPKIIRCAPPVYSCTSTFEYHGSTSTSLGPSCQAHHDGHKRARGGHQNRTNLEWSFVHARSSTYELHSFAPRYTFKVLPALGNRTRAAMHVVSMVPSFHMHGLDVPLVRFVDLDALLLFGLFRIGDWSCAHLSRISCFRIGQRTRMEANPASGLARVDRRIVGSRRARGQDVRRATSARCTSATLLREATEHIRCVLGCGEHPHGRVRGRVEDTRHE